MWYSIGLEVGDVEGIDGERRGADGWVEGSGGDCSCEEGGDGGELHAEI